MYTDILLAVDLNSKKSWKKALPTAVEYCQAFDATLHLLSVVPDFGMTVVAQFFPEDFEDNAVTQTKKALRAFSKKHVPKGVKVRHVIAYGTIYKEVLAAAKKVKADLVVLSAHRPELSDYLLGPNAARVVRHANCSVLVVRN